MKFIRNKLYSPVIDEAEMLRQYRHSGDLEILGRFYQNYMPLVYGLCLKYLKDEEQGKDAVMQIFEQLVEKLRRHEVSNFKSWLYSLSRNYCLMALRTGAKHTFVPAEDEVVEKSNFVHLDIDDNKEQSLNVMEKCMEVLPDEQRICIDLFYLQEKCYKEVADLTGFDMNKVKSYIQNGKRNLKICMEKKSGNE